MRIDDINAAVIGVGYLGRFHAEKLGCIRGVRLLGVVDVDRNRAYTVARDLKVKAFENYREIINKVHVVCVVTPTSCHYEIVKDFLVAGVDVLCEKPITTTLKQADELIELAKYKGCILQIGHLERFNPAVDDLLYKVQHPMFIECNRIAPFKARATDVDVILDLMIHDLDIILALVKQELYKVKVVGVPVLSEHADIVNVRLEFIGGCVANITASRLALKDERKIRVFQRDAYLSLDFRKYKLLIIKKVEYYSEKVPKVTVDRLRFSKVDLLKKEIQSFIDCVRTRQKPKVDAWQARQALACALTIRQKLYEELRCYGEFLKPFCHWIEYPLFNN